MGKCLVVEEDWLRCKLASANQIVEQVPSLTYLGVQISSWENLINQVRLQRNKATAIAGCLRETVG